MVEPLLHTFQFHNGSIKRWYKDTGEIVDGTFQFHNGSIKSVWSESESDEHRRVSIPQWFD